MRTDLPAHGDRLGRLRRRGRTWDHYAIAHRSGLFVNVAGGTVTTIGIEPIGDVVVRGRHTERMDDGARGDLDRRYLSAAGAVAGITGLLIAGAVTWRRR